jgi:hypothetical protein
MEKQQGKTKHPLYRVEQRKGQFVICDRHFRMGSFIYRACSNWGRFETREAAQTALDAKVAA